MSARALQNAGAHSPQSIAHLRRTGTAGCVWRTHLRYSSRSASGRTEVKQPQEVTSQPIASAGKGVGRVKRDPTNLESGGVEASTVVFDSRKVPGVCLLAIVAATIGFLDQCGLKGLHTGIAAPFPQRSVPSGVVLVPHCQSPSRHPSSVEGGVT